MGSIADLEPLRTAKGTTSGLGLWSKPDAAVPPWVWPLLFFVAALVQWPSLFAGYTYDDSQALLGHGGVTGSLPLTSVWTHDWFGRPLDGATWLSSWRPLTTLSMALGHRLVPEPWLHHAVNLLLYGAVTVLLFAFARRYVSPIWAGVAALLFALLPVHVEAVSSIVGRAELLASMFCLMSLFALGLAKPAWLRAGLASLLYLLALLAKESVALFPALLFCLWFSARRVGGPPSFTWLRCRELQLCICVGLVGLAYLAYRHQFLPIGLPADYAVENNVLMDRSGLWRITGNLELTGRYLEFLLWPSQLCADHTYGAFNPESGPGSFAKPGLWLGLVAVVLAVFDGYRLIRGRSQGLYFVVLISALLACQWLIPLSVIVAERLAFWPSIWFCLAMAASAQRRWPNPSTGLWRSSRSWGPKVAAGLGLVLLCLAAGRSWVRAGDWKSDRHLFRAQVRDCPRSVHGHFMYARVLQGQGAHAESLWQYVYSAHLNGQIPATPKLGAYAELEAEISDPEQRILKLPGLHGLADQPDNYWQHVHSFCTQLGATGNANYIEQRWPEYFR